MYRFGLLLALLTVLPCLADQEVDGQQIRGRTFTSCALSDLNLRNCKLHAVKLVRCSGDEFGYEESDLGKLSLRSTKLRDLTGYSLEVASAKLEHGSLHDAVFSYVTWRDAKFENCEVNGLYWRGGTARDLRFEQVDLRDLRWDNVDAADAQFSRSNLGDGRFDYCEFGDARFERGSFRGANFRGVDFSGVKLENCEVRGLTIDGVDIEELLRKAR